MHKDLLKRIISLILVLALSLSALISLSACIDTPGDTDNTPPSSDVGEGEEDNKSEEDELLSRIIVPPFKEYGRDTINFSDITYARPNIEELASRFESACALVKKNEISFEEQINAIVALENDFSNARTMLSFSKIYSSKNASDEYWSKEYKYISTAYPSLSQKIEDLFVAAANSPHAQRFEEEYFGDGLIENYKDGGSYTDEVVELLSEEAKLEADYSSISTSNITVTYKNTTASVDHILNFYKDKYGETSKEYVTAYTFCMQAYNEKLNNLSRFILIDLIKVRRLIADELGLESYASFAYKEAGHEYTSKQMNDFLDGIAEYIIPVYSKLYSSSFYYYFQSNQPAELSLDRLMNNGYRAIAATDDDLFDIYRYMLQYGLFDVRYDSSNRYDGSFELYLDSYNAPFIFITAEGDICDYGDLFHEFGHFADSFINDGEGTSLDLSEVSSQGLELLMLHYMNNAADSSVCNYLKSKKLCEALETLIFQGFYAKFEHLAYSIPYSDIDEASLCDAVVDAAEKFGFNTKVTNNLSAVSIPHIFLYPFYVQSYCTSVVPALELYFMEESNEGLGISAYKKLINRSDTNITFNVALESAGLSSPFDKELLKKIANNIHYTITGADYYGLIQGTNSAA